MSAIEHFARRASRDPFFLGFVLAAWRDAHGLTDVELARSLGCDTQTLATVMLCGTPRHAEDVRLIAERFGVSEEKLREMVDR